MKQRKKRKYLRDTNDYQSEEVFNWQLNLKQGKTGSTTSSPEREVRIVTPRRESRYLTPERRRTTLEKRFRSPEPSRQPREYDNGQERVYRKGNELRTPKSWWSNKNKNKLPRRPYFKNHGNRGTHKPHNSSYNQYGNPGNYGYQGNYNRNGRRNDYQYQNQYQSHGEQRPYDQSHYDLRRSPVQTQNRYEALRDYREEDNSRPFLDYCRSERTPPRYDQTVRARSPDGKGGIEEDSRSKRKRE